MKKLMVVLAVASLSVSAWAVTYDGTYVLGLSGSYVAPQGGPNDLVGSGCLAFDPSSTAGGEYNRIYILDTTIWWGHGRIHSFNPLTGTFSGPLTAQDFWQGRNLCVDSSGDVYVAQPWEAEGATNGTVFKVTDPSGAATFSTLLFQEPDADTYNVVMVPTGFGGGYAEGSDLLIGDSHWDSTTANGVGVLDAASTPSNTLVTLLFQTPTNVYPYIAASDKEGVVYISHRTAGIDLADLGGTNRVFVSRVDSAGAVERVFLDIDPAVFGVLDDGLEINQADGSLWIITAPPGAGSSTPRDVYRIDVSNATATNSDFIASLVLVIDDTTFDPGINGIAISPDGKQLALVGPGGLDTIYMYDIYSETYSYTTWATEHSLSTGPLEDQDGDQLNNLSEYAFGGDPTNALDQGISPTTALGEGGGTNWLEYVYPKQSYSLSDLTYYVEVNDDLIVGTWTNTGYEVLGTGMINDDFDAVTNRISTDSKDKQFLRLIVEQE